MREQMCKYDEAYTIQEMLDESNACPTCTLMCPNAQLPNTGGQRDRRYYDGSAFERVKLGRLETERSEIVRGKALELAKKIYLYCPECRERSLAFTKLEEALMWANKSISVNSVGV